MALNNNLSTSISNDSSNSVDEHVFKIPQIINKNTSETKLEKKEISAKTTPLSEVYNEPIWSGLPVGKYYFEEVKEGQIVKKVDLTKKPFIVIGRCEFCDLILNHPSVSRYHAVLQYRKVPDNNESAGFYLYDLGSTHGTFLNKESLQVKIYYKIKMGSHIKIGRSTRTLIFIGPDDEPETEMSWSQLKQKHLDMFLEEDKKKKQLEMEAKEQLKKEEDGVNWGMAEDADEKTDLSENPFAATQNEELYINDPKKTLSGWFEREGEELEYKVEEKGYGHFVCQIELPIEIGGQSKMIAEANVKGKKKEAIIECALAACRLLDRHGFLRQSNQESRKRVTRDWEAQDFYDSDEDNFLDRTGDVEKKRTKRMAKFGKLDSAPETYKSLLDKLLICDLELNEAKANLSDMKVPELDLKIDDDNIDELSRFMLQSVNTTLDRDKVKMVKERIAALEKEKIRLNRLINITQPPQVLPYTTTLDSKGQKILSKKRKLNLNLDKRDSDDNAEEEKKAKVEERIETPGKSTPEKTPKAYSGSASKQQLDKQHLQDLEKIKKQGTKKRDGQKEKTSKKTAKMSLSLKMDYVVAPSSSLDPIPLCHPDNKTPTTSSKKSKPKTHSTKNTNRRKKIISDEEILQLLMESDVSVSSSSSEDEDNLYVKGTMSVDTEDHSDSTWTPPPGQTGDGRTHLNDKLGY